MLSLVRHKSLMVNQFFAQVFVRDEDKCLNTC